MSSDNPILKTRRAWSGLIAVCLLSAGCASQPAEKVGVRQAAEGDEAAVYSNRLSPRQPLLVPPAESGLPPVRLYLMAEEPRSSSD